MAIEVYPELAAGLDGVEERGHLWVIYWKGVSQRPSTG